MTSGAIEEGRPIALDFEGLAHGGCLDAGEQWVRCGNSPHQEG